MSSAKAKFGGLLVLLLASGCPPPQVPQTIPDRVAVDPRQWQIVEREAPLVGDALIASLLAFSEPDPYAAALARDQAIDLARRVGLVTTTPRRSCQPCSLARTEGELVNRRACLAQRLMCLQPR